MKIHLVQPGIAAHQSDIIETPARCGCDARERNPEWLRQCDSSGRRLAHSIEDLDRRS